MSPATDSLRPWQLTATDPAVKAGRLCPKVVPWLGPAGITYAGAQTPDGLEEDEAAGAGAAETGSP